MWPIVTDGTARSVWSVCRSGPSVTIVSPAKSVEPIEMTFETLTRVSPMNQVLDGGPEPHVNGQY